MKNKVKHTFGQLEMRHARGHTGQCECVAYEINGKSSHGDGLRLLGVGTTNEQNIQRTIREPFGE